jgi:hypothetical protein
VILLVSHHMRSVVYRCPSWMFGLLVAGAIAPLAVLPLIPAFGWPPITKLFIVGAELALAAYALTLLPTKLVLSDEGLCQKQLLSELKLKWRDIAEWRYTRVQDVEVFWIRDRNGKKHELKHWLVFGKQRSKQVAEVLRQNGVAGREDYDG